MFVLRSIVVLLFVSVFSAVSAHPVRIGAARRHIRARGANGRTCKSRTSVSVSSSSVVVTTSATVNTFVPVSTQETSSTHVVTSSQAEASSTHVATTSSHDATTTHVATSTEAATTTSHSSSHSSSHTSAHTSAATSAPSGVSAATEKALFAALAPVSSSESWSTSPSAPNPLPLDDATFQVTKLLSALAHPYVKAPDGVLSMEATYPEGSYNFDHDPQGGFSFYALGPDSVDLTTAKEATLGYSVYFPEDFDFNIGGKLPGLCEFITRVLYFFSLIKVTDGGNSEEEAVSCSGGRRDDGCFSSRLMWRTAGAGELYTYLPPDFDANNAVCDIKPFSTCNPTYGASVGRGSYTFKAGSSNTISMRVRLNDVNQQNGELQLWANGESVINVGGLVLRNSDAGRIRGIQMQTFFGGT